MYLIFKTSLANERERVFKRENVRKVGSWVHDPNYHFFNFVQYYLVMRWLMKNERVFFLKACVKMLLVSCVGGDRNIFVKCSHLSFDCMVDAMAGQLVAMQ